MVTAAASSASASPEVRDTPPPRPYQRLLRALRVSAWSAIGVAIVATIVVLLLIHRGDPEGAARIANREIESRLQPGEAVELRLPVMQRQWWNYFRVTHGILAITNRRLIFVGVPPEEFFPHEDEPPELEEEAWTFDALLPPRQRSVFKTATGLTVGNAGSRAMFAVSPRNGDRLDSLVSLTQRKIAAMRAAEEALRRAEAITLAASREAIYHRVQRGETLDGIAALYGTIVDSLRAWNTVPRDRIYGGQRLLVKPAGR